MLEPDLEEEQQKENQKTKERVREFFTISNPKIKIFNFSSTR